jgi:hypothetical protein
MIRLTPRALSYLRCPWPVERPADQELGETPSILIRLGLMYCEPIGHGWARLGLTDAGREAIGAQTGAVSP